MKRFLKWLAALVVVGALLGAAVAVGVYMHFAPKLPEVDVLKDVRMQVPLRVYSQEGLLMAEYGEQRREPVIYSEVPKTMINAFVAIEDSRFFDHFGVDIKGLVRAAVELVRTGERRQGASTITMQVARNFFLTREKTYIRKLNEILLALKIERTLSKEEIFELYLNKIYLGNRAYGVGAAARVYYGKTLDELTLAETAMIAGLPKAPSKYNPIANPARALQRRDYILRRMAELDMINQVQLKDAVSAPVTAKVYRAAKGLQADYVAEMVRSQLSELYPEDVYTSGLKVYTTIRESHQNAARNGLQKALHAYEKRHGYKGPVDHFEADVLSDKEALVKALSSHSRYGVIVPAIVTDVTAKGATIVVSNGETKEIPWKGMAWARRYVSENRMGKAPKRPADVVSAGDLVYIKDDGETPIRLEQLPSVEGAFVSLNPSNGAILSLVGGYDFNRSKFNRVMQAERQPGSNIKPFIYAAAMSKGKSAASIYNDAPVVFEDVSLESEWRPENYSGRFYGPTRLREALIKSRNLVSIRVLMSVGINYAREYLGRVGFPASALTRDLSLSLGSGVLKPIELAAAYSVLANGGYRIEPYFIERIENMNGEIVFKSDPATVCKTCGPVELMADDESMVQSPVVANAVRDQRLAPQVMEPRIAYIVRDILRDVVQRGTATRAKALKRADIGGKTGTTNDQHDAWFSGFNSHIAASAWVGFDANKPLGRGEVGGRAALPIWMSYMEEVLKDLPEDNFELLPRMVTVRIDKDSGEATSSSQGVFEIFREENVPRMQAQSVHSYDSTVDGSVGEDDSLF